jgi:hypothetical protein
MVLKKAARTVLPKAYYWVVWKAPMKAEWTGGVSVGLKAMKKAALTGQKVAEPMVLKMAGW